MISASANSLMPDFSGLTADISKSVSQIKAKAQALQYETTRPAQNQNIESSFQGFSLNNYAVSYLEPQALYSLHRFVAETDDSEKLKQQSKQRNIFNEEDNNTSEKPSEVNIETPLSFWEELSQNIDSSQLLHGMEAYGIHIGSVDSGAFIAATKQENVSGSYATGAYDYAFNINTKPQVLIDFMHEFNRSYDYTI